MDEFVNSGQYKKYARLKEKLEENDELRQKVESFYKKSEMFELKRIQGEETDFDEERVLSNQYTEIWLNETGNMYMAARNDIYKALARIYEIIENKCEL